MPVPRRSTATLQGLLALTAQRPGMLRFMEWDDIIGIDWGEANADTSEALWNMPASKIKQELHLRTDEAFDHPVPLSLQAVDTLRAVRWLTGRASFVFPGARSGLKSCGATPRVSRCYFSFWARVISKIDRVSSRR